MYRSKREILLVPLVSSSSMKTVGGALPHTSGVTKNKAQQHFYSKVLKDAVMYTKSA